MKKITTILLFFAMLISAAGCSGLKVNRTMLRMIVSGNNKVSGKPVFADSLERRRGVPYMPGATASQVLDIYYAPGPVRRNAVLIDIHGGFYVSGRRENTRSFASRFLREGYDVVLVEYRVNDGELDVSDGLKDCAAALDFIATNADSLGLDPGRMFLTGDSAGGHLALYMGEGAMDDSVPVRPSVFKPRGILLNCPAYDFASFARGKGFTEGALEWFLGPRYRDGEWMARMSPRTFIRSYTGPLFVSTSTRDFIREQSLILREDRLEAGLPVEFLDIESEDRKAGHVHNVVDVDLPQSRRVNDAMVAFMDSCLGRESNN